MRNALISLLLLCSCAQPVEYVSSEGLELYQCGTQLCLIVEVNGNETTCVEDSGARGTLWLSHEVAGNSRLQELWCYDSPNAFGSGRVEVCLQSAAQVCWQQEGQEHCEEVYPYSVEMIHDCLFGLD
jgi:hypothetical protein